MPFLFLAENEYITKTNDCTPSPGVQVRTKDLRQNTDRQEQEGREGRREGGRLEAGREERRKEGKHTHTPRIE